MKILLINTVCGIRSTGRICTDLAQILEKEGHLCKVAYGREEVPEELSRFAHKAASDTSVKIDALKTRILDNAGFNSKKSTRKFIEWVKDFAPDVIHLHNIHGYYINIKILFEFLKEYGKPVIWTLHDCWAFTGHCSHFTLAGCDRWKSGCYGCKQKSAYPSSLFRDNSKNNYKNKKELFTSLENLTVITPSEWLCSLARESYLGKYPVYAIPNGVDLEVFRPTDGDFREKHGLSGKKIILGAATAWSKSKGLYEFSRLADIASQDYRVVLVGVDEKTANTLSPELITVGRTNSIREMAEIYTAADVFVNASSEETMGLTTVEAMACGTPAVVSNRTAVPEVIRENGGIVISDISAEGILRGVQKVLSKDYPDTRSNAMIYEKKKQYDKYIQIYNNIFSEF